jgi:2-polyprenyl-6-hydroxyphenyl methylase/3-demethylubiquinone-9 3-methyltransferase
MFEYIQEKEKMIVCCHALLKNGGRLLISVPNRRSIYRKLEKISYRIIGKPSYCKHVYNRYTEQELIAEFGKFGFVPLEKRYYADNYLFSGLLKLLFPPAYSPNLLLVVFQKKK